MFTLELQHAIFLLRLLQSLGAFIGMALAARVIDLYNREGPGTKSAFNFSLFTNLVGLVLSGLINAAPFLYNRLRWTWTRFLVDPFGETVGSLTFILFFFISGVVVALNAAPDTGGCSAQHFMSLVDNDDGTKTVNDSDGGPAACRTAKAAAAFDFLTLATWIGTFALLVYSHCYRLRVLFIPGAAAAQAGILTENATMASMSPSGNTPVVLASSHPMQQSPSQQHGATSKLNENTDSSTTTSHQSPTNNSPYIKASNAVSDSAVIDSHNSNNGKVSAGVSIPVPAHVYQPNAPSRPGPMASSSSPSLPLSVNTAISMPMPQPVTANYPYTVNPVPPTSFPVPMTAALTQGSSNESPSLSMPHPTSTGQSSPILSFSTTNPPSPTFPSPHPQQHRRQFSNEYRPVTNAPSMVASYDPSAYTGRTAYTSYTRTVTPPTTLQDDRSVYPASTDAIYHGSSRATDSILSREAFSIPSIRSREEEPERHSLYPASTDGLYQGSSRAPSLPDEVKE